MMHFLAHGLYEKALNRLTPAELVELRGHVASPRGPPASRSRAPTARPTRRRTCARCRPTPMRWWAHRLPVP